MAKAVILRTGSQRIEDLQAGKILFIVRYDYALVCFRDGSDNHVEVAPGFSGHGTPSSIADLATHSLIGFDQATEFIRNACKALPGWRREAFALRTDSDLAQLALIRSGSGIGICQVAIARRDDAIVRILPKQMSQSLETWITMREDLRNSPRCKVTFEALVNGLQPPCRLVGANVGLLAPSSATLVAGQRLMLVPFADIQRGESGTFDQRRLARPVAATEHRSPLGSAHSDN